MTRNLINWYTRKYLLNTKEGSNQHRNKTDTRKHRKQMTKWQR